MDVTAELTAPCPAEELFAWVDDLGCYPEWLDIVPRVEPADPHPDDAGPAWHVTLRGRLGPFARAKRLRMVRTVHDAPLRARFERAEHDGRDHSAWVLTATVSPAPSGFSGSERAPGGGSGSILRMDLYYGGALGGPPVEKLLEEAITASGPRLLACVTGSTPASP